MVSTAIQVLEHKPAIRICHGGGFAAVAVEADGHIDQLIALLRRMPFAPGDARDPAVDVPVQARLSSTLEGLSQYSGLSATRKVGEQMLVTHRPALSRHAETTYSSPSRNSTPQSPPPMPVKSSNSGTSGPVNRSKTFNRTRLPGQLTPCAGPATSSIDVALCICSCCAGVRMLTPHEECHPLHAFEPFALLCRGQLPVFILVLIDFEGEFLSVQTLASSKRCFQDFGSDSTTVPIKSTSSLRLI